MTNNDQSNEFANLRQKAEEAQQGNHSVVINLDKLTSEDIQQLFHELQVHQIELEMQNDELRRTQEELEASRDSFVNLYDFAPVGYLTISETGIIKDANLTIASLLGDARGNLLEQPFSKFIAREDQDAYYLHFRRLFELQEPGVWELRTVKEDGSQFWTRIEVIIAKSSEGKTVCRATVSDISEWVQTDEMLRESKRSLENTLLELRETQEQMIQQQSLVAVGQLSAGIAHDFNNILGIIILNTQLLLRTSELPPTFRTRLRVVSEQSNKAAELVQQVLDFGRRSVIERRPLAMDSVLKDMVKLLQRTLPESIQINLVFEPGDYTLNADPTRIQQAFVNLALNARDAMPDGGILAIKLSKVKDKVINCVECGKVERGEWIRVTLHDNGTGIAPDSQPHVFEPFFTTKAPLGHGLGLAQVYGIVKQHEGHMEMDTVFQQGTIFNTYWPTSSVIEPESETPEQLSEVGGAGQTILVVEDDENLRIGFIEVLEILDYQVLGAANGQEALEVIERYAGRITLVLSDLVMPIMGGLELVHELEARNTAVNVLIITGHPMDDETKRALPKNVVDLILKPLSIEQLAEAVSQAVAA